MKDVFNQALIKPFCESCLALQYVKLLNYSGRSADKDGLFITLLETKDMLSSRQGWLVKNFNKHDDSHNPIYH